MTHEPECPSTQIMVELRGDPQRCALCAALRSAYQRGRADEFNFLTEAPGGEYQRGRDDGWMIACADGAGLPYGYEQTRVVPSIRGGGPVITLLERIRAAARGDGEQK